MVRYFFNLLRYLPCALVDWAKTYLTRTASWCILVQHGGTIFIKRISGDSTVTRRDLN